MFTISPKVYLKVEQSRIKKELKELIEVNRANTLSELEDVSSELEEITLFEKVAFSLLDTEEKSKFLDTKLFKDMKDKLGVRDSRVFEDKIAKLNKTLKILDDEISQQDIKDRYLNELYWQIRDKKSKIRTLNMALELLDSPTKHTYLDGVVTDYSGFLGTSRLNSRGLILKSNDEKMAVILTVLLAKESFQGIGRALNPKPFYYDLGDGYFQSITVRRAEESEYEKFKWKTKINLDAIDSTIFDIEQAGLDTIRGYGYDNYTQNNLDKENCERNLNTLVEMLKEEKRHIQAVAESITESEYKDYVDNLVSDLKLLDERRERAYKNNQ